MEGPSAAAVRAVVEPAVRDLGYDLILVEITGGGGRRILRLFIDRAEGVGLADCVTVSRELSPLLDVEDPIDGPYSLEVSSPGLDRPLARSEDFERFRGSRVRLRTGKPVEGRRNFSGTLRGLEDGEVLIEDDDGALHRVPFAVLKRANVEYDHDAPRD